MSENRAMTIMALAAMFERAATASVAKGAQAEMNSPHILFADPHGAWSAIAEKIVDLIEHKVAEALKQGAPE